MEFVEGKNGRMPDKTYPDSVPPHGVTETRTQGPSTGRRATTIRPELLWHWP